MVRRVRAHPDLHATLVDGTGIKPLGGRLTWIGNGNVPIDVIRLLCRSAADFGGSDINDGRLASLLGEGITSIDVLGRSSVGAAKFDYSMLHELLELPGIHLGVIGLEVETEACEASELIPSRLQQLGNHEHRSLNSSGNSGLHSPNGPRSACTYPSGEPRLTAWAASWCKKHFNCLVVCDARI